MLTVEWWYGSKRNIVYYRSGLSGKRCFRSSKGTTGPLTPSFMGDTNLMAHYTELNDYKFIGGSPMCPFTVIINTNIIVPWPHRYPLGDHNGITLHSNHDYYDTFTMDRMASLSNPGWQSYRCPDSWCPRSLQGPSNWTCCILKPWKYVRTAHIFKNCQ